MKTFQNFVRVLSITSVIFLAKAGVVFITMQGSALAYGGPHHYEDSRSLTKSYGSKSRSFRNSGSLRSSRRLGGGCLSVDCPEIVVRAHRLARMDSFGSRLLRESCEKAKLWSGNSVTGGAERTKQMRSTGPFDSCCHIRRVRGCWSCELSALLLSGFGFIASWCSTARFGSMWSRIQCRFGIWNSKMRIRCSINQN